MATHNVLATGGLAPDQRLLGITSPHLLKANGAVAFDLFAVLVLLWAIAGLIGGRGRIGKDVPEFVAEQGELVDVGIRGPEDRL